MFKRTINKNESHNCVNILKADLKAVETQNIKHTFTVLKNTTVNRAASIQYVITRVNIHI